jgi:drug/metabolite transporter (DMT)-like permease
MQDSHHQKQIITGIGLAVLATIIWSGNFIVARGVIKVIPPVTLSFYRWLTATIILVPFAWKYFAKEWRLVKENFPYFFFVSVTGVSMFNTFVYIAGHYSEAINLALIGTTSSPIISVILAKVFLKERISFIRITGMIICITGILLLLSKGNFHTLLTFSFSKGDWWILAAAFSFAIYNTMVKKKPAAMNGINFLFVVFGLGTVMLIPFYLYELNTTGGFAVNISTLSVILYLGLGTSVICFLLWNIAISKLGTGRTALFGNLIPVFSSIEAVFILGEKLTWIYYTSFALVITGLVIANLQKRNL